MGDQNNADFLDDFVVTVRKPKSNEDRPLLPELCRLPAVIKQIKKKQMAKSKTVRAQFTFIISSGKFKDQYAWGSVPLHEEVTEKADLYKWMCNILGKTSLAVDNAVTIGDLVGKSVDIMIKNTKSNGKVWQNVTEVLTPLNAVETEAVKVDEKVEEKKEEVVEESKVVDELDVTEEISNDEISEDDLPF